jgi:hypothetical protein
VKAANCCNARPSVSRSEAIYGVRVTACRFIIRVLKHSAEAQLPDCGSYEARFPDGRSSTYFYWDDNPGRRSITQKLRSEEAESRAKALARTEQDKLDRH